MLKSKGKELALDALHLLPGTFLYAGGIYCFTAPNEIAPGGVSGISTIGRVSQGVRVMRVEDESRIVCVTATERDEDESGEEAGEDGNVMEPVEQDSLDMDVGEQNSENQPEETDE